MVNIYSEILEVRENLKEAMNKKSLLFSVATLLHIVIMYWFKYEKRFVTEGKEVGGGRKKIITFIVATNVVASRLPELELEFRLLVPIKIKMEQLTEKKRVKMQKEEVRQEN